MKQSLTVMIIQLKIHSSYETEPYSADHSIKDSHIIWNRALQCWSFN